MARPFAEISFTPNVQTAQERYGSRTQMSRFQSSGEDDFTGLTEAEVSFIQARDGFYQATVSETGWPYVQFRGGPAGFLKVFDEKTIGYADFRGNRQYLSVGNINGNDRVAMILMDYANRRRLKILARAEILHNEDAPEILESLQLPDYRARVERAVVLHIEATDWNCPQHITPRFTEADIADAVAPLRDRLSFLETRLAELEG
ncbi:pyridoxamine 5'-phosphate oxidase family protein [Nisaea sp.]|uniref:pyridoxamine 5'-phosphate oxidase family protein n=1 Tax=Nisaea sp. TaxID=2024842 RepID=UPI003265BACF